MRRLLFFLFVVATAVALPSAWASAASTVGTNVSTDGTLSVTGVSTLTGLSTHTGGFISAASSTISAGGLNVQGNLSASSSITFAGNITPSTNNARDLGAYGLAMRNLYASSTARLDYVSSTQIETAGFVSTASSTVNGGLNVVGNLSASSSITVGGAILPGTNNERDLGAFANAFRDIYVSSSLTIGGNAGTVSSTAIRAHISALATANLPPVTTNTYRCVTSTVDVSGTEIGDTVIVAPTTYDPAFASGTMSGLIVETSKVELLYCGGGGGPDMDPGVTIYRIDVWKH